MVKITESRKLITESLIECYQEEFKLLEPTCCKCDKHLGLGDYLDGFFPYEIEHNICKQCRRI